MEKVIVICEVGLPADATPDEIALVMEVLKAARKCPRVTYVDAWSETAEEEDSV